MSSHRQSSPFSSGNTPNLLQSSSPQLNPFQPRNKNMISNQGSSHEVHGQASYSDYVDSSSHYDSSHHDPSHSSSVRSSPTMSTASPYQTSSCTSSASADYSDRDGDRDYNNCSSPADSEPLVIASNGYGGEYSPSKLSSPGSSPVSSCSRGGELSPAGLSPVASGTEFRGSEFPSAGASEFDSGAGNMVCMPPEVELSPSGRLSLSSRKSGSSRSSPPQHLSPHNFDGTETAIQTHDALGASAEGGDFEGNNNEYDPGNGDENITSDSENIFHDQFDGEGNMQDHHHSRSPSVTYSATAAAVATPASHPAVRFTPRPPSFPKTQTEMNTMSSFKPTPIDDPLGGDPLGGASDIEFDAQGFRDRGAQASPGGSYGNSGFIGSRGFTGNTYINANSSIPSKRCNRGSLQKDRTSLINWILLGLVLLMFFVLRVMQLRLDEEGQSHNYTGPNYSTTSNAREDFGRANDVFVDELNVSDDSLDSGERLSGADFDSPTVQHVGDGVVIDGEEGDFAEDDQDEVEESEHGEDHAEDHDELEDEGTSCKGDESVKHNIPSETLDREVAAARLTSQMRAKEKIRKVLLTSIVGCGELQKKIKKDKLEKGAEKVKEGKSGDNEESEVDKSIAKKTHADAKKIQCSLPAWLEEDSWNVGGAGDTSTASEKENEETENNDVVAKSDNLENLKPEKSEEVSPSMFDSVKNSVSSILETTATAASSAYDSWKTNHDLSDVSKYYRYPHGLNSKDFVDQYTGRWDILKDVVRLNEKINADGNKINSDENKGTKAEGVEIRFDKRGAGDLMDENRSHSIAVPGGESGPSPHTHDMNRSTDNTNSDDSNPLLDETHFAFKTLEIAEKRVQEEGWRELRARNARNKKEKLGQDSKENSNSESSDPNTANPFLPRPLLIVVHNSRSDPGHLSYALHTIAEGKNYLINLHASEDQRLAHSKALSGIYGRELSWDALEKDLDDASSSVVRPSKLLLNFSRTVVGEEERCVRCGL